MLSDIGRPKNGVMDHGTGLPDSDIDLKCEHRLAAAILIAKSVAYAPHVQSDCIYIHVWHFEVVCKAHRTFRKSSVQYHKIVPVPRIE